jgi:hypothetical protein
MTKRGYILEILKNNAIDNYLITEKRFEAIADAILALPIEMPSEEEIHKNMIEMNLYQHNDEFGNEVWDEGKLHWATQGYRIAIKWMKDEIIKRNK